MEEGSPRVAPRVTDELASAFLGQAGPDGHQGPRGWSLSCSPHSPGPPLPPLPTSQCSAPSPPITRPEGIHHREVCKVPVSSPSSLPPASKLLSKTPRDHWLRCVGWSACLKGKRFHVGHAFSRGTRSSRDARNPGLTRTFWRPRKAR